MNGYFDYNATTRPCEEALTAWEETERKYWHNPSGLYPDAAAAYRRLEDAREHLADLIGCDEPERLIFTSGATEANNSVFAYFARSFPGKTAIIGSAEHPSVHDSATAYFGNNLELIDARRSGVYEVEHLSQLIAETDVAVVSALAANNETGVLQPWQEMREICDCANIPFHCDAAQWIGKLPSESLGSCDFVTGSAHKFRGLKGVGFLVIPEDSSLRVQIGGPQENSRRAGTENLASIVAMVTALETTLAKSTQAAEAIASARNGFEAELKGSIPGLIVAGEGAERLWNTSMLIVPDYGNLKWITRLGKLGFSASTGSACSAGKGKPSLALRSMGFDFDQMGRAVRFSAGCETTEEDWGALSNAVKEVWAQLSGNNKG